VAFSEVDAMGIVWHGRYATYLEDASAELRTLCGLSHQELFAARLRAPIVRFHLDYLAPLVLDDLVTVTAMLIWHEGARLNIEYAVTRPDSRVAATGYTVQLFTDAATGEPYLASPDLLEQCRRRWRNGELSHLQ
jgi:acyl-CoA thioester hydrolase